MTLRDEVAQALTPWVNPQQNSGPVGMYEQRVAEEAGAAAGAAIGVVLGVVADEIKALPNAHRLSGDPMLASEFRRDVLAVVERLRGA